jgi:hypothetical protein
LAQVLGTLFLALAGQPGDFAFCATTNLIPVADTMIMEVAPSNNAGGLAWLTAGGNHYGVPSRGLLKFDLAGSIAAGSRITAASLDLWVTQVPGDGYAVGYFGLHRLLRGWGEGTNNPANAPGQGSPATTNEATWLSPFALTTNTWHAPGAAATNDYYPAATAVRIVYDVAQSPYTFPDPSDDGAPMIADIQRWLDHPATNFGWIFICESETVPNTTRRFASREDPNTPPSLHVTYVVPPRIDSVEKSGGQFRLHFTAQAGQAYTVQFCNALGTSNVWSTLTNLDAPPAATNVVIGDASSSRQRFYRLMTY